MDREELLALRRQAYEEYTNREILGEFDANSKTINLCLKLLVELFNHQLQEQKRHK